MRLMIFTPTWFTEAGTDAIHPACRESIENQIVVVVDIDLAVQLGFVERHRFDLRRCDYFQRHLLLQCLSSILSSRLLCRRDRSFAFHRHRKRRVLDSLRQLDWASRDMRRRHKQVEAATRDLAAELQRNPTEGEVAQKLGMDQERWRTMMIDLRNVGLISASTRGNEGDDLPAPDFPSKPETHPDSICAREQLRSVLGDAMKTLPERYQKVVMLYYTNEMTMKEIGGILGINESRVSQIHKSALEKMQVALESTGITSAQAF